MLTVSDQNTFWGSFDVLLEAQRREALRQKVELLKNRYRYAMMMVAATKGDQREGHIYEAEGALGLFRTYMLELRALIHSAKGK